LGSCLAENEYVCAQIAKYRMIINTLVYIFVYSNETPKYPEMKLKWNGAWRSSPFCLHQLLK